MKINFEELCRRQAFSFGGSEWVKNSSRTAKLIENGRIFYFGKREKVLVKSTT